MPARLQISVRLERQPGTLMSKIAWMRRYQKRCTFCANAFDWGYAPDGAWCEGKEWSCGCTTMDAWQRGMRRFGA